MAERDPGIDPEAGDAMRGPKSERYVGLVKDNTVLFSYWRDENQAGTGTECSTSLKTWRKWAKKAEVIHIAD